MRRYASHKDKTHRPVVEALRKLGATVQVLDGKDVPDLLVGYKGRTFLIEVKRPAEEGATLDKRNGRAYQRAAGKLSEGQEEWQRRWRGGPVLVVHTPVEAMAVLRGWGATFPAPGE